MRVAEKKLFSRDENDNSDLVQSSPKGKFVPFEKKNTYIGVKTAQNMKDLFQNIFGCSVTLVNSSYNVVLNFKKMVHRQQNGLRCRLT